MQMFDKKNIIHMVNNISNTLDKNRCLLSKPLDVEAMMTNKQQ